MDRATELNLIHYSLMKYATAWAGCSSEYYWKGMAAGLIYAYLILTNDFEGYDEYNAMLGM